MGHYSLLVVSHATQIQPLDLLIVGVFVRDVQATVACLFLVYDALVSAYRYVMSKI